MSAAPLISMAELRRELALADELRSYELQTARIIELLRLYVNDETVNKIIETMV